MKTIASKYKMREMLACCVGLLLVLGIAFAGNPNGRLQERLFRLHILANSDSAEDQALKLSVRDEILPMFQERFDNLDLTEYAGSCYAEKAANAARQMMGELSAAAQQAVYAHGSTQTAAVMIGYEPFPVKTYGEYTVPAGEYWCLRIVLGSGKGQNWWCVLYPPLCLSPATAENYFDAYEMEILTGTESYRFRFAIWDWFCKWRTGR